MFLTGKKRAFTLIELLVSVAIFSGIVVLALGAFARSADSSIRSSDIRERTDAARTIVDRISADMQYVHLEDNFTATAGECASVPTTATGAYFNSNCLFLLLKLPGETTYIAKKYDLDSAAIQLSETRDCTIVSGSVFCGDNGYSFPSRITSEKFILQNTNEIFSGINPFDANTNNTTPIIGTAITVSEAGFGGSCSSSPASCYTIKSSFVPGG